MYIIDTATCNIIISSLHDYDIVNSDLTAIINIYKFIHLQNDIYLIRVVNFPSLRRDQRGGHGVIRNQEVQPTTNFGLCFMFGANGHCLLKAR